MTCIHASIMSSIMSDREPLAITILIDYYPAIPRTCLYARQTREEEHRRWCYYSRVSSTREFRVSRRQNSHNRPATREISSSSSAHVWGCSLTSLDPSTTTTFRSNAVSFILHHTKRHASVNIGESKTANDLQGLISVKYRASTRHC